MKWPWRRNKAEDAAPRSFVMDVVWNRSEELRPDRLGPSEDDIPNEERVRTERWRPQRSLGPLP